MNHIRLNAVIPEIKDYYRYDQDTDRFYNSETGGSLYGTATPSGTYMKFQNKSNSLFPYNIRRDRLVKMINDYIKVNNTTKVYTKEATATINVEKDPLSHLKGWIIGSVDPKTGSFSISTKPKIHTSEVAVKEEIERLARNWPNKVFVKMKVENFVRATGINWF